MIEALVSYIQDKGFSVLVGPAMMMISKIVNGQRVGEYWAISNAELAQAPKEVLFFLADERMDRIDKAIAQVG